MVWNTWQKRSLFTETWQLETACESVKVYDCYTWVPMTCITTACLSCRVDDDLKIKVGDFGLARDVYDSDYYRVTDKNAKLPVKWMSPEAVHDNISNEKTDVVSKRIRWEGGWL